VLYICAALQSLAYTKKTFLDVVVGIFCLVGSAFSYFSSLQCCCITEFLSLSKACNDTIVTIGDIFIELSSRFLLFVFSWWRTCLLIFFFGRFGMCVIKRWWATFFSTSNKSISKSIGNMGRINSSQLHGLASINFSSWRGENLSKIPMILACLYILSFSFFYFGLVIFSFFSLVYVVVANYRIFQQTISAPLVGEKLSCNRMRKLAVV